MYNSMLRNRNQTPQTQAARADQILNNAGGYSFKLDKWKQLRRFLILGTIGGSFYVSEQKLTDQNVDAVIACIKEDGLRVIADAVQVSTSNLAAKNEPAILTLALCLTYGDETTRSAVKRSVPAICRTGTHLFHFAEYLKASGKGWGRATRGAIASWYHSKKPEALAYQFVKYQQRDGWSHKDLLRMAHVMPLTRDQGVAFKLAVSEQLPPDGLNTEFGRRWTELNSAKNSELSTAELVNNINLYHLEREFVLTEALQKPAVWSALLQNMGLTAILRNLGNLADAELLKVGSEDTKYIVNLITNQEQLKKQRIHPLTVLQAFAVYRRGAGIKGSKTWTPIAPIIDALDDAFYKSFVSVEPSNQPMILGVDVSGSMSTAMIESLRLTAAQLSMALAVILSKTEKNCEIIAFDTSAYQLQISARQRLDDIMNARLHGGGTDISIPIRYALANNKKAHIVSLTDSETWAGRGHVFQALNEYRRTNPTARYINIAMAANTVTNNPPEDELSLEAVGFSADLPQTVSGFLTGKF